MIIAESLPAHSKLEIGLAGDSFTFNVSKRDPDEGPVKKAKTQK
jgi:hypothetical protein